MRWVILPPHQRTHSKYLFRLRFLCLLIACLFICLFRGKFGRLTVSAISLESLKSQVVQVKAVAGSMCGVIGQDTLLS